jgi:prevent-host-death family protein
VSFTRERVEALLADRVTFHPIPDARKYGRRVALSNPRSHGNPVSGQLNLVNMTDQINVQDAKTRLSSLLVRVERGEDIIIARGGKPIARLTALEPPTQREVGFVPDLNLADDFFEPLSEEELRLWEGLG